MVTCANCGAEVPEGADYCIKCGRPVEAGEPCRTAPWEDWGRDRGRDWGWWPSGPPGGWIKRWSWLWSAEWIMINLVILGVTIVLIGLVLFLAASGATGLVTWSNFWAWLLIGIGVLTLIRNVARYFVAGRWLWHGGIAGGLVLITFGAAWLVAEATGWDQNFWAFVIVAGGLSIVVAGIVNYLWAKARPR